MKHENEHLKQRMNFKEPTLGTSSPSEIGNINKDNKYSNMNFFSHKLMEMKLLKPTPSGQVKNIHKTVKIVNISTFFGKDYKMIK